MIRYVGKVVDRHDYHHVALRGAGNTKTGTINNVYELVKMCRPYLLTKRKEYKLVIEDLLATDRTLILDF